MPGAAKNQPPPKKPARLRTTVHVDGVQWGPGEIPDEIARRISNPKAFEGDPPEDFGADVRPVFAGYNPDPRVVPPNAHERPTLPTRPKDAA